jgi:S1-C subfamily serine protease
MFTNQFSFKYLETIVPIVGIKEEENRPVPRFLGTGTFIEPRPYLVTAAHVIKGWNGTLGIMPPPDGSRAFNANPTYVNPKTDLALLRVPDWSPQTVLKIAEDERVETFNQIVACFEYGTTRTLGETILFHPAWRMGNITRIHGPNSDVAKQYGQAGEDALELSFPALRGASGAPVFAWQEPYLYGIIIANVSYHLLPAQIETILDEKNQILEETQFMLPQAIAVHARHLRTLIQEAEKRTASD